MFLLELDDDDHDFSYAAFIWLSLVAGLWYWSRRVEARDAAQRIDAAARGNVDAVRERVHRQRSGSGDAAAGGGGGVPIVPGGVPAAGAAAAAPREREDCPICLDRVTWPIDTNCSHTFCAQCFISYHEQASGLIPSMVKCPCCRRPVDVILPSEPGWTEVEVSCEEGRTLRRQVDAYNTRYSSAPRSWNDMARDAPHYLTRFWRELTSGGPGTMAIISQFRFWAIILGGLFYLLAPVDLLPEAFFGIVGLIDDIVVVTTGLMMVAGVFRSIQLQQRQ